MLVNEAGYTNNNTTNTTAYKPSQGVIGSTAIYCTDGK
jgi:hypothetical protein